MKVRPLFFSQLKDVVGAAQLEVEIADHATVGALLEQLYARVPKLREWDRRILVGVGVEFVERDHVLQADDEIAIMPPVQGG